MKIINGESSEMQILKSRPKHSNHSVQTVQRSVHRSNRSVQIVHRSVHGSTQTVQHSTGVVVHFRVCTNQRTGQTRAHEYIKRWDQVTRRNMQPWNLCLTQKSIVKLLCPCRLDKQNNPRSKSVHQVRSAEQSAVKSSVQIRSTEQSSQNRCPDQVNGTIQSKLVFRSGQQNNPVKTGVQIRSIEQSAVKTSVQIRSTEQSSQNRCSDQVNGTIQSKPVFRSGQRNNPVKTSLQIRSTEQSAVKTGVQIRSTEQSTVKIRITWIFLLKLTLLSSGTTYVLNACLLLTSLIQFLSTPVSVNITKIRNVLKLKGYNDCSIYRILKKTMTFQQLNHVIS
jgi:hypothetical protein